MPLYDYLCSKCGKIQEAYRTIADRDNGPTCCRRKTVKQISHYHVAPMFTAYRATGKERGKVIRSRAEHRDYLNKHDYIEVGNDKSLAPPPHDPDRDAARAKEVAASMSDMQYAPPE